MTQRASALGIDHGTKRTGFAVADPLRIVVEPLEVWHGDGDSDALVEHVATLMEERTVDVLVVGFPYNMDGSEGPRAAEVQRFMRRLSERFPGIAVVPQDERLSTKEAEELLRKAGYKPRSKRRLRDSFSAVVILNDWIRAGEPR
jgi:putative Holliday junction resolvase